MGEERQERKRMSLLEWVAPAIGLVLTLGLLGFVGWEAWAAPDEAPPQITVTAGPVTRFGDQYVLEVTARNHGPSTAARVEVEATLRAGGGETTSRTMFDFIPAHSERRGGLFFPVDPRSAAVQLRALGYAEP